MKMAKERNKNLCFVEQPAGKWSINDRWVGEIECVCVCRGGLQDADRRRMTNVPLWSCPR